MHYNTNKKGTLRKGEGASIKLPKPRLGKKSPRTIAKEAIRSAALINSTYVAEQIKEILFTDQKFEKIINAIIDKAQEQGDHQRFGFLLDRAVGKVPDRVEAKVAAFQEMSDDELLKIAEDYKASKSD